MRLMEIKHLIDFHLRLDLLQLLLEVLELVVQGHVFDNQREPAEQLLVETNLVLVDQLEEDLDADRGQHQHQVGSQLQVLQDLPLLVLAHDGELGLKDGAIAEAYAEE